MDVGSRISGFGITGKGEFFDAHVAAPATVAPVYDPNSYRGIPKIHSLRLNLGTL